MNIKQIEYVAEAVRLNSFSAAAKNLGVTVQAVSKAISELEDELDRMLFVRESRGVFATPFALTFCEQAMPVLQGFDGLRALASGGQGAAPALGSLRFALNTPQFPGCETVCDNVATLLSRVTGAAASVSIVTGTEGLERLRDGSMDAMITVGLFSHPDTVCKQVGTVPVGVLMGTRHPLASKNRIALEDLVPYDIAVLDCFDEANQTITELYRGRADGLRFVPVAPAGLQGLLARDGVIFTTGIAALGASIPSAVLRLMAPDDAMPIPICVVCCKERAPFMLAALDPVFSKDMGALGVL